MIRSLESKLPSVGTTIFTVMSRLAADLGAINLSQGFPDFDCDPALVEAVAQHMRAGRNQYAPMQGVPALREAIAAKYETFYGRRYDPETEVTVTSGGTEAIFDAVAAVVHSGDEVIVLEPCYDSYVPAIELERRRRRSLCRCASRTTHRLGRAAAAVTPRTRLLIINSPHNPTGAVLTADDIRQLRRSSTGTNSSSSATRSTSTSSSTASSTRAWRAHEELAARSFIVGSFGKTYHTTGWKVGYTVAPAALMTEFRKVHQFVTFSTNTPVQHAIADFSRRRRGPARARTLLPGEARSLSAADGGIAVPSAALSRELFPADGLLGHLGRSGRGLRDPPHQRARRRIDSDVAVPLP